MLSIQPQILSSYAANPASVVYGLYCVCEDCTVSRGLQIRYIGITVNGVEFRLFQHLKDARDANYAQLAKSRWIKKHGSENIRAVVVEEVADPKLLNSREVYWIKSYRTHRGSFGLNMTSGGDGVSGYEYSAEQRKSMSDKAKARGISENVIIAARSRVGTKSHLSTSDEETVSRIKVDLWNGTPPSKVADTHGVSRNFINHINNGRTWLHVPWPIGPRERTRTRELQSANGTGRTHSIESRRKQSESASASWTEERKERQREILKTSPGLLEYAKSDKARAENGRRQTSVPDEVVREIRERAQTGEKVVRISEALGVPYGTCARIARGDSHNWVT